MDNDFDDIDALEAKETKQKLPLAWLALFFGLIAWGVVYFFLYSPATSGWTQEKAYQESVQPK